MHQDVSTRCRRVALGTLLWIGCVPVALDPIVTGSDSSGSPPGSDTDTATGPGQPTGELPGPTTSSGGTTVGPGSEAGSDGSDADSGEPGTTGGLPGRFVGCDQPDGCRRLDVVIVVDNSGSMGEEQQNLAANLPHLVERLRLIKDPEGDLVDPDVHVMVTTTDVGHPLCMQFNKPDYTVASGAPVATACVDRLTRFNGLDGVTKVPQACTANCPEGQAAVPMDPYVHFNGVEHNVIDPDGAGDAAADALACIGPQGIDGCGMEAPLEAMLLALQPDAPWNMGERPFLRDDSALAIIILTDESDCSVEDFAHFDPKNVDDPEFNQHWEPDPDKGGVKSNPTSAVCWNAGMSCEDADADGVYESCVAEDKDVLHPLARYTDLLISHLEVQANKPVFMLVLGGVPPVTAHDPAPPGTPTDGGVLDLVYRDWIASDILPGDPKTAAKKQYEFGVGPGCSNPATGQGIPPGRVQELCQALDRSDDPNTPLVDEEEVRCCIESVCDDDFAGAFDCLAGMLSQRLSAPG